MEKFLKQESPFVVPTTDGKLIEEHYGMASSGDAGFSVAHMVAPPGWAEPHQTPQFDEVTVVIKGKKQIEADGEIVMLTAGETILIRGGTRVRYSNPFDEPCEYWAMCVPAFNPATVGREEA